MAAKGVPSSLWDYGLVYESEILSRISRAPNERSGIEQLTWETPDISNGLTSRFMTWQLQGRVIRPATEPDGTKKGMAHRNPLFDTRAYLVEFKDGSVAEYTADIIAENIYSQVDQEGRSFSILQEITDHKVDPKVVNKKATQGWKLLVEWKDGFSKGVSLKALKESNTIEVAEYVQANLINKSPVFRWWVSHVLRK